MLRIAITFLHMWIVGFCFAPWVMILLCTMKNDNKINIMRICSYCTSGDFLHLCACLYANEGMVRWLWTNQLWFWNVALRTWFGFPWSIYNSTYSCFAKDEGVVTLDGCFEKFGFPQCSKNNQNLIQLCSSRGIRWVKMTIL